MVLFAYRNLSGMVEFKCTARSKEIQYKCSLIFTSTTSSTGLLVSGNNPKCQQRVKSVCDKSLSFGQRDRNEVRL